MRIYPIMLCLILSGCGNSGGSGVNDSPRPVNRTPYPNLGGQGMPTATRFASPAPAGQHNAPLTGHFSPQGGSIVQGTSAASPFISEGYSVHPLSPEQKAKVNEVLEATNRLRAENHLPPLRFDDDLAAYAYVRADENRTQYAHERPNNRGKFSSGLNGNDWRGENLDASRATAAEVMNAWENSDEHRKNLLNPHFSRIGIATVSDPNSYYRYYWAQIFAGDKVSTAYHFDPELARADLPAVAQFLSDKATFADDGKMTLAGGRYQVGKYQIDLQDPQEMGFSYQTFGTVSRGAPAYPVQFINVGKPTLPPENANFQAHYEGSSLGYVQRNQPVRARVSADVNFGAQKGMDVYFTDSQALHSGQMSDLDFAEHLIWDSGNGQFTGETTNARFYGTNGEEMGGQFSRRGARGNYEGVFGLRKQ